MNALHYWHSWLVIDNPFDFACWHIRTRYLGSFLFFLIATQMVRWVATQIVASPDLKVRQIEIARWIEIAKVPDSEWR